MAVFFTGTMAPYRHQTECTWVYGSGNGTVGSTAFGSCVGLVLYKPAAHAGAVAHFAGSMGNEPERVDSDVDEILGRCRDGTLLAEQWQAWVFGGNSLHPHGQQTSTPMRKVTRRLIRRVSETLPKVARWRNMTVALQDAGPYGHTGVTLNVATGAITWDDPAPVKTTTTRNRLDYLL